MLRVTARRVVEARQWAWGRISEKYRLPEIQRPDGMVAGSIKSLASRFYHLKTGRCLTVQYLNWTKSRPTRNTGGVGTERRPGTTSSRSVQNGSRSRRPCGQR